MIRKTRNGIPVAVKTVALGFSLMIGGPVYAESRPEIAGEVTRTYAMEIEAYRRNNERQILSDFLELLRLPNVTRHSADIERNAVHIVGLLEQRGLRTRLLRAGGAPYIYAEYPSKHAEKTVLLYAHYDGQSVAVDEWNYDPFSPVVVDKSRSKDGGIVNIEKTSGDYDPEWRVIARSASDDKLPIIALVHALEALTANGIPLSVNLKILLDGEEEHGSPTIRKIIEQSQDLFESDLMLFCDGPQHQSGRKQLVFGVRGFTGVDITVYGPNRPLHSGHYGNWAPNPIMQLAHLLTSMRDASGKILIEDYYDDVSGPTTVERDAIAKIPDWTKELADELAVAIPEGDGAKLDELIMLPAINARGIAGGGVGNDSRNVILPEATVSLDLRLVPNQTVERVRERLEEHIEGQGFHMIREAPDSVMLKRKGRVAKVVWQGGYPAYRAAMDSKATQRLVDVMRRIAPDTVVTPTMGGSLPLYEFGSRLPAPIVILPLANHDNNQHAENENLRLGNLWEAVEILANILATYGAVDARQEALPVDTH